MADATDTAAPAAELTQPAAAAPTADPAPSPAAPPAPLAHPVGEFFDALAALVPAIGPGTPEGDAQRARLTAAIEAVKAHG